MCSTICSKAQTDSKKRGAMYVVELVGNILSCYFLVKRSIRAFTASI